MKKIFTFHTDPAHGWLEVNTKDLVDLDLKLSDFSAFSYANGGKFYLEEDRDAGVFMDKYSAKHGPNDLSFMERHIDGEHEIRSYPSIGE